MPATEQISTAPASALGSGRPARGRPRWLIPAIMIGSCVAGAVLQFAAGLPGVPVWAGVLGVEMLVLLIDRSFPRAPALEQPAHPALETPPAEEGARTAAPGVAQPDEQAAPEAMLDEPPPAAEPAPEQPVADESVREEQPVADEPLPDEAVEEPPAAEDLPPAGPVPPPEPDRPWVAQIAWHEGDGRARFTVIARTPHRKRVKLARSHSFAWPPPSPDAVGELARAVEELEAALLTAGWTPAGRGSSWYARRYDWQAGGNPAAAPRLRAEEAVALKRSLEWPPGTEDLVRCEIEWASGYRTSRFEAVVRAPGAKRGRTIGASDGAKWMFKDMPSPREPEHVAAVKELRAALRADGWDEVEPGPAWFARRFVWRRDTPAPEQLGSGDPQPPLS